MADYVPRTVIERAYTSPVGYTPGHWAPTWGEVQEKAWYSAGEKRRAVAIPEVSRGVFRYAAPGGRCLGARHDQLVFHYRYGILPFPDGCAQDSMNTKPWFFLDQNQKRPKTLSTSQLLRCWHSNTSF